MKITKLIAEALARQVIGKIREIKNEETKTIEENISSSKEKSELVKVIEEIYILQEKKINIINSINEKYVKDIKHVRFDKYALNSNIVKVNVFISNSLEQEIINKIIINKYFAKSEENIDDFLNELVKKLI